MSLIFSKASKMSYPVNNAENEYAIQKGSQFDIKKFVYKIIEVLPWFILSVGISIFAAKMYLRYTLDVSKISAFLLIKDQEEGGSSDYKALKEMGLVNGNKDVQNEIDIIKSYSLMKRVVDSLHLNINLYKEGRVTASPTFGDLMPVYIQLVEEYADAKPENYKLIVNERNFTLNGPGGTQTIQYGQVFEVSLGKLIFTRNENLKLDPGGYRILFSDRDAEAKRYRNAIDVRKTNDMGGIIEISMLDEIPQRAIMIINKLIDVYNYAGLDDKNIAGKTTIKFLNERIDTVSRELNEVEMYAERFKRDNKIGAISEEASMFLSQALAIDNKKSEQSAQIKVLESLEDYVGTAKGANEIIPSGLGILEPSMLAIISNYNQLVQQKQAMSLKSTEADPTLRNLLMQLRDVRENLLKNIKVFKTGLQTNLNQVSSNFEIGRAHV